MTDKTPHKPHFGKNHAIIVFLLLFLCTILNIKPVFAEDISEYKVKAAFVSNFALLTKWPQKAFASDSSTIKLCVLGDKSLMQAFASLDGKIIGKQTLQLTTNPPQNTKNHCHIVFFGKDIDTKTVLRTLNNVSATPVLTIGEKETFIAIGGVIRFFMEKERLKFEINPAAAQKQDLRLSSRLLKVAKITGNE